MLSQMFLRRRVKYRYYRYYRYSCQIVMKRHFFDRFSENAKISDLNKIRPVRASSMRTDGQTVTTKLTLSAIQLPRLK